VEVDEEDDLSEDDEVEVDVLSEDEELEDDAAEESDEDLSAEERESVR
jgi:hypothetical protein